MSEYNVLDDPALEPMVLWYTMSCLDKFEALGFELAKESADAALEFSLENPLLMRDKGGEFPSVNIPHFGEKSGPYCAVLMAVFLVWSQKKIGNPIPSDSSKLLSYAEEAYNTWERFFKSD